MCVCNAELCFTSGHRCTIDYVINIFNLVLFYYICVNSVCNVNLAHLPSCLPKRITMEISLQTFLANIVLTLC